MLDGRQIRFGRAIWPLDGWTCQGSKYPVYEVSSPDTTKSNAGNGMGFGTRSLKYWVLGPSGKVWQYKALGHLRISFEHYLPWT